jgi:L-asparaginase II
VACTSRTARKRARAANAANNQTCLHNNCSGKHAGMLAVALHLGAPIENYDSPENPVQKAIADVSQFSGVAVTDMAVVLTAARSDFRNHGKGDGAGVCAIGFAAGDFDRNRRAMLATNRSRDECVSGIDRRHTDRLDTEIMRAAPGRVISKVGAEGVYTAGINPCEEWPNGLGLALKIEDGDDKRARPTVVIESLRQLGVLRDESLEAVAKYAFFPVRNRRGEMVGEISASFELKKPSGEVYRYDKRSR